MSTGEASTSRISTPDDSNADEQKQDIESEKTEFKEGIETPVEQFAQKNADSSEKTEDHNNKLSSTVSK